MANLGGQCPGRYCRNLVTRGRHVEGSRKCRQPLNLLETERHFPLWSTRRTGRCLGMWRHMNKEKNPSSILIKWSVSMPVSRSQQCEDTVFLTQALAFYISTSGTGLRSDKSKSDPNVNDGRGWQCVSAGVTVTDITLVGMVTVGDVGPLCTFCLILL